MRQHLLAIAAIMMLATTAASATPGYRFLQLPSELGSPIDISNDGGVLFQTYSSPFALVYKQGQLDTLALPQPVLTNFYATPVDINSRQQLVGNHWYYRDYGRGYVGSGFFADRDGGVQSVDLRSSPTASPWANGEISVRLAGINDNGVAVGELVVSPYDNGECVIEPVYCTTPVMTHAIRVVDGEVQSLDLAGPVSSARSINNRGDILGWYASSWSPSAPPAKNHFIMNDRQLTVLDAPATSGDQYDLEFIDINDRGQVLGRWLGTGGVEHSFIREPGGAIREIEWAEWSERLVVHALYPPEDLELGLVRSLGVRAHRMNDRGQVVASAQALYEGQRSNGTAYSILEQVHLIGTPVGRPNAGSATKGSPEGTFRLKALAQGPDARGMNFRFELPHSARVTMRIHDVRGRLVSTLLQDEMKPGRHSVSWSGRTETGGAAASGAYFARLEVSGLSEIRRFVFLR